ncbi:Uncharacterized protein TPAR_08483 [Tolypocladium paradoxum]|uniref:Uncharacterized protein n=1 Tax=Tolypocladium paradoxum TaxID=94208 RepID=A0A2S4KM50_9HYPO|nr:Uncharacterized protein TPAR_08483 [Tolypocladium paradoxum]
MHLWTRCSALLAGLTGVAAQFSFPVASTALKRGERCQIRWNTKGLQGPLSINLIPSDSLGSNIVAQRIATNVENTGILAWAPDLSTAAFPSFSMVIIDSRSTTIASEPFLIGSLTQQPALTTAKMPQLATLTAENSGGQVVTRTATTGMKNNVVPSPTGPIELHQSGTKVLGAIMGADPAEKAGDDDGGNAGGLKPLPAFAGGNQENTGGALQPLPNMPADSSQGEATTATTDQEAKATQTQSTKDARPAEKPAASAEKPAANTGEAACNSVAAPTPPPADGAVVPEQAAPGVESSNPDEGAATDSSSPPGEDKAGGAAATAELSPGPPPGTVTGTASITSGAPRPSFTTLTGVTLSPSPVEPGATGATRPGLRAANSAALGVGIAPGVLRGVAGFAALAIAVVL